MKKALAVRTQALVAVLALAGCNVVQSGYEIPFTEATADLAGMWHATVWQGGASGAPANAGWCIVGPHLEPSYDRNRTGRHMP